MHVGRRVAGVLTDVVLGLGQITVFVGKTISLLPVTIRQYRKQTAKTMNDMAWGSGSLIVDGGVVSLMFFLGIAVGAVVAIMSFMAFDLLGFGALTGITGSFGNIRVIAPIITGIGFAAQAGCRMTAEIGAMRISEEIDATEAMGLRAIPFVVGTRLIGGMLVVLPSYLLALVVSFFTGGLIVKLFHDQPDGTYDHYFAQFVTLPDLLASVAKALLFCAVVTLIHCYYGYFASGGPAGVGQASGRAIRASLVAIVVLNFVLTVAIWGLNPVLPFRG
ncbi:MlaE family ABC transporter permease [Gordonia amicalis]|uniref:MlaE family ABC transporter permease n=1 Tax=Gordonia amicalis TaxID=89053 RepID=UPI0002A652B2|nr:ABC transporter permease [Gordonia amicalis]MBA5849417.1 ABC transporter permease [Gordonia amicalis]MDV7171871.1 ABC transporter permease [Gordonia amicalis]NKX78582.1 ABC transporter permease [Gordonia amicalis]UOG23448.1 ABC transporter permease [Gordonia amicalis]GAC51837.1 YrbE family protein [Gordonia amicalis NBRC 100051 = JCM 11271]